MSEVIVFFPSLILVTLFRRSKPRHPRTLSPVAEAIGRVKRSKSSAQPAPSQPKSCNERFYFPWWCLIVAYLLSFIVAGVSLAFVVIFGISYGDEKVRRWLGSIAIGFFSSIFFTQPLKVLSLLILFYMCCRRKSRAEVFIDEEDPIEDFTVATTDAHKKFPVNSFSSSRKTKSLVSCFSSSRNRFSRELVSIRIERNVKNNV